MDDVINTCAYSTIEDNETQEVRVSLARLGRD